MDKKKWKSYTILIVIIVFLSTLSGLYISVLYDQLENEIYFNLRQNANIVARSVKSQIKKDFESLQMLADRLSDNYDNSVEDLAKYLPQSNLVQSFKRIGIIELEGMSYTSDGISIDFSDRDFFIESLQGRSSISEVLIDRISGGKINVYSIPLKKDDEIFGVLFATLDSSTFTDIFIVDGIFPDSSSYLVDQQGNLMLHSDSQTFDNLFDLEITNKDDLSNLKSNLNKNEVGIFEYRNFGEPLFVCYAPIDYNNWFVVSEINSSIVKDKMMIIITETFGLLFFFLCSVIYFSYYIFQRRKAEKINLYEMAYTDATTGYHNWNYLNENAGKIFSQNKLVLIALDIDNFKIINDMYGYSEGNYILKNIADNINKILSEGEVFVRHEADNFIIVLKQENETFIHRLTNLIDTIEMENGKYHFNLSAGIYRVPDPPAPLNVMYDHANLAKKYVKNTIDVKYCFYDEVMLNAYHKVKLIENDMMAALINEEFVIYLQPKVDINSSKVIGAEALVRWNHPKRGLIPPLDFIDIFERNNFIILLDKYVLNKTVAFLSEFREEGHELFPISVNLSRKHLDNENLAQELFEIINAYDIPLDYIELELTENIAYFDEISFVKSVNLLKDKGFKISIDDFGSGYSSLKLLKDLGADVLKIDKDFFKIISNERDRIILKNIINMANDLNIVCVCEGVETQEQIDFLKSVDCCFVQGYFYSKPLKIEDFKNYLMESASEIEIERKEI